MRKMLVASVLTLMASQSFGATVHSAKLDESKKNILIDVGYSGGCGTHEFSLDVGACMESYPVQCSAKLIHKSKDICEALISETVVISLEKAGLTDSYYERASLTIIGDEDWQTSKPTQATVQLP